MSRSALPPTVLTMGSIFFDATSICLIKNSLGFSWCTKRAECLPGMGWRERPMFLANVGLPNGDIGDSQRGWRAQHEQRHGVSVDPGVIANRLDVREQDLRIVSTGVEAPQALGLIGSVRTTLKPPTGPPP